MSSFTLIFAVVAILIAINGFYVAAEFAAVSAKRSRLAQLADAGNNSAHALLHVLNDPHQLDAYIAACQVGITLSSLVLGFYAQDRIIIATEPYLASLPSTIRVLIEPASFILILLGLTILQVILGELVPKSIGVQYPEKLALWTAKPMGWSLTFFRPMIWLFNGSGRLILRLLGINGIGEHVHIHSPDEIVLLVEESSAGGVLDHGERQLLVNTLQLRNRTARKVMVPRNRMLAAPVDQPADEVFQLLASSSYSRLPLYEGSVDHIVGIVHVKDLLALAFWQRQAPDSPDPERNLRDVMHPVLFVPDSIQIEEVIAQMQKVRQNIAIVVDEYGGTAGLLAFEDLMEEIIGDFQDEFDAEFPPLRLTTKNQLIVRGELHLDVINNLLGTHFYSEDVETIGGLVANQLGKIPTIGERIVIDEVRIRVEKMDQQRVAEVNFSLTPAQLDRLAEMTNE